MPPPKTPMQLDALRRIMRPDVKPQTGGPSLLNATPSRERLLSMPGG